MTLTLPVLILTRTSVCIPACRAQRRARRKKNSNVPHILTSTRFVLLQLSGKNLRIPTKIPDPMPQCFLYSLPRSKRKQQGLQFQHAPILDEYRMYEMAGEALRSMKMENAGGTSAYSEGVSIQYFLDLGARSILCEREVSYDFYNFKMVDFIATFQLPDGKKPDGKKSKRVGVSVTRACQYNGQPFDKEKAEQLLTKKLYGLVIARRAVSVHHTFYTSVLHILCESREIQMTLSRVYNELDKTELGETLRGTLILVLTLVDDPKVFSEKRKRSK